MGFLSKVKKGIVTQNKNRKERNAKGLGFKSNEDRIKQSQHAKAQAIKRNNNKKRKAELARVGKEATMTKAEKIQRGVKKFRSEMDSIQKESGGMFGNGNMTSNTLGVKKRKAKSVKNPFDNGFQSRRFF
jgi:hypothetical protein